MITPRRKQNLLALTYWSYKDGLVQSAVMPYLRIIRRILPGSKIFLVTLEQSHLVMSEKESRRVKAELRAEGIHLIDFGYTRFGVKAMLKWLVFLSRLLLLSYRERISIIHAWCTPAGGAGYILSKLKKVLLVIDSYEPHAESMVELGTWRENGLAHRILFLLEKLQSRRAYAVIATTKTVRDYAIEKYQAEFERFYVKPASVDLTLFSPEVVKNSDLVEQFDFEDKIVCVYAGKIGGIYLEREIFDFFKVASDYWGPRFRALLLTNADKERIAKLASASGLDPDMITVRYVPFVDMPKYMGLGDFAINPVRPIPTKKYCTSIKDGEYWAMGLPVVIPPNIGDDSDIIGEEGIGAVVKSFTSEGYLDAVREIDALLKSDRDRELSIRIRAVADKHRNLANTEQIYRELYGDASETWRPV